MDIQTAIKQRLSEIELEHDRLSALLDVYGTSNGHDRTKSEEYRHELKLLTRQRKAWHITDIEVEFKRKGLGFSKPMVHQALSNLRDSGDILAVRINGSNQKYFYMNPEARDGERLHKDYLPISDKYIESIEFM